MDPDQPESRYIQQHLANERTFLAWIRTSITIIGIGFLSAGLVFHSSPYGKTAHAVAAVAGIGALLFGILLILLATKDYLRKRNGINSGQFSSSLSLIRLVCVAMAAISCTLAVLVFILLYN